MHDGSCIAFFDLGDGQIAEPSPNTPSWVNHIALRVDTVEALEAARKRLTAAGVSVLGPVDHAGYVHSIYFFDPNGIRLELTAEIATDQMISGYRAGARELCDRWTQEKQARGARA